MKDLYLSNNKFDPEGYWSHRLDKTFPPIAEDVALFDQNGYDLTPIEISYSKANGRKVIDHREHRYALKQEWLVQHSKVCGAVLNHCLLLERKGYAGSAREQLEYWAEGLPLLAKILKIRPKWGLDFSMDYVDKQFNSFEVLHWEWDSFDYDAVQERKLKYEQQFLNTDWDDAAKSILAKKDKWHHLDFFAQSDWKCNYFGIEREQFKQVIWE